MSERIYASDGRFIGVSGDGKDERIAKLEAENELLRADLEAECRDADAAVDSVVAKVKWYHEKLARVESSLADCAKTCGGLEYRLEQAEAELAERSET